MYALGALPLCLLGLPSDCVGCYDLTKSYIFVNCSQRSQNLPRGYSQVSSSIPSQLRPTSKLLEVIYALWFIFALLPMETRKNASLQLSSYSEPSESLSSYASYFLLHTQLVSLASKFSARHSFLTFPLKFAYIAFGFRACPHFAGSMTCA